jgi:hypothetical protein
MTTNITIDDKALSCTHIAESFEIIGSKSQGWSGGVAGLISNVLGLARTWVLNCVEENIEYADSVAVYLRTQASLGSLCVFHAEMTGRYDSLASIVVDGVDLSLETVGTQNIRHFTVRMHEALSSTSVSPAGPLGSGYYVHEAAYIVYESGAEINAINCSTWKIDFHGVDLATVVQSAIDATTEGLIILRDLAIPTITEKVGVTLCSYDDGAMDTQLGGFTRKTLDYFADWSPPGAYYGTRFKYENVPDTAGERVFCHIIDADFSNNAHGDSVGLFIYGHGSGGAKTWAFNPLLDISGDWPGMTAEFDLNYNSGHDDDPYGVTGNCGVGVNINSGASGNIAFCALFISSGWELSGGVFKQWHGGIDMHRCFDTFGLRMSPMSSTGEMIQMIPFDHNNINPDTPMVYLSNELGTKSIFLLTKDGKVGLDDYRTVGDPGYSVPSKAIAMKNVSTDGYTCLAIDNVSDNLRLLTLGLTGELTASKSVIGTFFSGLVGSEAYRRMVLDYQSLQFGAGTTDTDAILYRNAANQFRTADQIVCDDGIVTKAKAGTISDADFTVDTTGLIGIDTTNNRIYFRTGPATWKYCAADG